MTVVISYSRDDREVVARLRADLAALGEDTWMDQDVVGGTASVLGQVRQASVLVFALSDAAWWSEVCRRELDYAERLGIPVVFVRVGPLGSDVARLFEGRDLTDYTGGADVRPCWARGSPGPPSEACACPTHSRRRPELPFAVLYRLSGALGPEPVTPDEQDHLVSLLRRERLGRWPARPARRP